MATHTLQKTSDVVIDITSTKGNKVLYTLTPANETRNTDNNVIPLDAITNQSQQRITEQISLFVLTVITWCYDIYLFVHLISL